MATFKRGNSNSRKCQIRAGMTQNCDLHIIEGYKEVNKTQKPKTRVFINRLVANVEINTHAVTTIPLIFCHFFQEGKYDNESIFSKHTKKFK